MKRNKKKKETAEISDKEKSKKKPGKLKNTFNKVFSRRNNAEALDAATDLTFWAGIFMFEPTIFVSALLLSSITSGHLKKVKKEDTKKIKKKVEKREQIEAAEEERKANSNARVFSHFKPKGNKPK